MAPSNSFHTTMLAPKYWLSWVLVAMAWLVARLPLTWILALGRCLGHIVYRLGGSRRHIAEVNIKLCFPELSDIERAQLVKENLLHTGMGLTEATIPWLNPKRDLREHTMVIGLEHLDAAKTAWYRRIAIGRPLHLY
jgi:KDO2-lipid IV(A) lauroyltransferase